MTTGFVNTHFIGSAFLTAKHGIDSSRDLLYYGTKQGRVNDVVFLKLDSSLSPAQRVQRTLIFSSSADKLKIMTVFPS